MAIARDQASTAQSSTSLATTVIDSITTGTGSNLVIISPIIDQGNFGNTDNVTLVTANASTMTRWAFHGNGNNPYTYYFYALVGAAANTAYTITATRTITGHPMSMQTFSYSAASQTNSADATSFSSTGNSTTLTAVAANCWAISCASGATPNSGGTNFASRGTTLDFIAGDSNGPIASGGATVSFTPNSGTGDLFTMSLAPIISAISELPILGVG